MPTTPPHDRDTYPGDFPPDTQTQRLLQIRREVAMAANYMCLSCGATIYEADALYLVLLPHAEDVVRYTVRDFGVRCTTCCPEPAQHPALEIVPPVEDELEVYSARSPTGISAVDPDFLAPIRETPPEDPWNEYHDLSNDGFVPVVKTDLATGESTLVDDREQTHPSRDDTAATNSSPPGAPTRDIDGVTWVFDALRDPDPTPSSDTDTDTGRPPGTHTTPRGGGTAPPQSPPAPPAQHTDRSARSNLVTTSLKVVTGTAVGSVLLGTLLWMVTVTTSGLSTSPLAQATAGFGEALATAPIATLATTLGGIATAVYLAHLGQRVYSYADPFFPPALPTTLLEAARRYDRVLFAAGIGLFGAASSAASGQVALGGGGPGVTAVLQATMAAVALVAGTAYYTACRDRARSYSQSPTSSSTSPGTDQAFRRNVQAGVLMRAAGVVTAYLVLAAPRTLGGAAFLACMLLFMYGRATAHDN